MATGQSQQSQTTTDHEKIRAWAEARGGVPASVMGTERGNEAAGLLRIKFEDSGEADDRLEEITWEEFFEKFEGRRWNGGATTRPSPVACAPPAR